ncbi:MAG: hypothetical protein RSF40_04820 [Oscillospiraceae bacterium]
MAETALDFIGKAKPTTVTDEFEQSVREQVKAEIAGRLDDQNGDPTLKFLHKMGVMEDVEVLHRLIMASKNFKEVYLYSNKLAALSKYVSIIKMSVDVAKKQKDMDKDVNAENDNDIDSIEISMKR